MTCRFRVAQRSSNRAVGVDSFGRVALSWEPGTGGWGLQVSPGRHQTIVWTSSGGSTAPVVVVLVPEVQTAVESIPTPAPGLSVLPGLMGPIRGGLGQDGGGYTALEYAVLH